MSGKHFHAVFVALALLVNCARAGIVSGVADAGTSLAGTQSLSFNSNTSGIAAPPIVSDSNTGQGAGKGAASASGLLQIAAHACVEPPLMGGTVSTADGDASVMFNDTFSIQSSTLPLGTPVTIDIEVAANVIRQTLDVFNTTSGTLNAADASVGAGIGANSVSIAGHYSFRDLFTGTFETQPNGIFAIPTATLTLPGQVGQTLQLSASLSGQSTSDVFPGDKGEVQVEAALAFGAISETPGVSLVSQTTGLNIPDTSNVTPSFVQANTFPPLVPIFVPEPGSLMLAAFGLAGLAAWSQRQRRSRA